MPLVLATFNVNSIRARMHILLPWLDEVQPDIVCLQETKVQDHEFPEAPLRDAGYHVAFRGQKSYNGVAILSKSERSEAQYGFSDGGPEDAARLMISKVDGLTIVNTYVPQGRDVDHEYYAYKLEWFARLRRLFDDVLDPAQPVVWVGDLNVAPTDIDVHDHKKLLGHVCFNPDVTAALESVTSWGFVDVFRKHVPEAGVYTYYDYRARNAIENGKGWRIDHIQASPSLAARSLNAWVDLAPRRAEKPSDHTPLLAAFEI